jgi:hypothetical protein
MIAHGNSRTIVTVAQAGENAPRQRPSAQRWVARSRFGLTEWTLNELDPRCFGRWSTATIRRSRDTEREQGKKHRLDFRFRSPISDEDRLSFRRGLPDQAATIWMLIASEVGKPDD